jgi:hypothetical protein
MTHHYGSPETKRAALFHASAARKDDRPHEQGPHAGEATSPYGFTPSLATSTSSRLTVSFTVSVRSVASLPTTTSSTTRAVFRNNRLLCSLANFHHPFLECARSRSTLRSDWRAPFYRDALTPQRHVLLHWFLDYKAANARRAAINRALPNLKLFLGKRDDLFAFAGRCRRSGRCSD